MSRQGSDRSGSTATSSNRRRFSPGYDFSYRFGSASTFRRVNEIKRPYTSPSLTSGAHSTGIYQKAYRNAIASAQSPSVKMMRESLGDGILMLRQERQYIKPSIFLNLDKIYEKKTIPADPEAEGSRALLITPQPPIPVRGVSRRKTIPTIDRRNKTPEPNIPRYSSRGIQVNISSPTPSNASRRPSTAAEIVVDFLTRGGFKEASGPPGYRARSGHFSKQMDFNDRCMRSSDYPDIQIEGRSLSRTMRAENSHMSREYCDVLGPLTCPDCIRTKIQNNHQRMCNAVVTANATDVYKLALIHERIPHLSIKEVQRKIFDGEISDKVDNLSRWKEIQHTMQSLKDAKGNEEQRADQDVHPAEKPPRPKLRSRGSITSAAFEPIPEASEVNDSDSDEEVVKGEAVEETKSETSSVIGGHHVVIMRHEGEKLRKIDVVTSLDVKEGESAELSPANTNEDNAPEGNSKTAENGTAEGVEESHSSHEEDTLPQIQKNIEIKPTPGDPKDQQAPTPTVQASSEARNPKQRRRVRKRSSKSRQLRVFNRGLIPSPNYFYNMSDLMQRVHKSNRIAPKAPWDVEVVQANDNSLTEPPKEESAPEHHDDTSSVSSQGSSTPRTIKSLLNFEPPIMFEKKGRYLGVNAPAAGSLASSAQTAA